MSYRDEEVAGLLKKVSDLQDVNRELRDRQPKAPPKAPKKEWKMPDIENVAVWTFYVAVTTLAGLGLWALGHVIFMKAKIEYCYASYAHEEINRDTVYLKGYRPWAEDIVFSKHASFHDAVLAAAEMRCPLTNGIAGQVQP